MLRVGVTSLVLVVLIVSACGVKAAPPDVVRFNRDVRPILSNNCFYCHGPDPKRREADLRLDVAEGAMVDLGGYAAVVPGNPDKSMLLERVASHEDDLRMPPLASKKPRLTDEQIAILQRWIEQGAKYEGHWAFLPLAPSVLSATSDVTWARNPIDQFILARLEQEGIAPSPEADAPTLIRRLSLDLTGLLPTPEQVDAFQDEMNREPVTAFENLVDRLMSSPHYGERWGRHWLDQARYADSNGYSVDSEREIWPFRDWVIQAANSDMPFDQFTTEQLAGDLLPAPTKHQLVATAFHRNTLINEEGGTDKAQFRHESVVDRVNTTAAVWLGLTVGCAQCHSHKFDPIQHREYYELFAFFNNTSDINSKGKTIAIAPGEILTGRAVSPSAESLREMDRELARRQTVWESKRREQIAGSAAEKKSDEDPLTIALQTSSDKRDADQKKRIETAFLSEDPAARDLKANRDAAAGRLANVMIMDELVKPRETYICVRGDFLRLDKEVGPLAPDVLDAVGPPLPPGATRTRLDLARWLVDPENPLTPRVTMNRVWMRFFGRGLVETEEDFGTQGSPPTHPELLDWLAAEFIRRGWSLKQMQRLIVTSAAYRQASRLRPELAERDPRNLLLARQERLRVEAEIVRDAALSASGQLDRTMGGPSVRPPQPEGVYAFTQTAKKWAAETGAARYRRGMYTMFFRSAPYPLFTTFDVPDFQTVCTRRIRSNTPLQALTVANDEVFVEIARGLAVRVWNELPAADPPARLRRAFRLCLCREPSDREFAILAKFYDRQLARSASEHPVALFPEELKDIAPPPAAIALVLACRAMLNSDSFITRE